MDTVLSDFSALAEQLGSGALIESWHTNWECSARVRDEESLRSFLLHFREQLLLRYELPSILEAYEMTNSGRTRDLLLLDARLGREPGLTPFANASRHIGQTQLERLRPLRDQRTVQRYLQAVEEGRAVAWHTLVYGMTLAVYSLPLRQGLLHYSQQTLYHLISAAAASLNLAAADLHEIWKEFEASLPALIDTVLPAPAHVKVVPS